MIDPRSRDWSGRLGWAGAGAGIVVGFAAGLVVGLAAAGHLSAPLLAAIAGSAGVVVAATALVLNHRNAKADRLQRLEAAAQARRDQTEQAERDRQRAANAVEHEAVTEAALVTVELFGGGAYGHNDPDANMTGTSLTLRLINGSTKPVTHLGLAFDPVIRLKDPHSVPGSLSPGENVRLSLDTYDYVIKRGEMSGARLFSYRCTLSYRIGPRWWRRVEDEPPVEVNTIAAACRAPGAAS